ncbi:MAG TPA: M20/M25/M40 family metallo-hydrolase [Thermoleophilaceae bacterium]
MGSPAFATSSSAERMRLLGDFVRLCELESPSRRERPVADALTADLRALGLEVEEDQSGAETGADAGNLLARIPGPEGARTILLCAHMDTVPLDAPVDVVREHDAFVNRNAAILGADNKAAVVTIMGAARRLVEVGSPVTVELLFTTCEEQALAGAKAFDAGRLRSEFGFVFDHASPVGEVIVASPTYYRLVGRMHGAAAHAGMHPERGHNAIVAVSRALAQMPLGRLDDATTANAGRIDGGTAANVVAERCVVELEARSLDEARAGELVGELVDKLTEAASDTECDVETSIERLFRGYRLPRTAQPVVVAERALASCGIEPVPVATGGGSDANVFIANGLTVVNLANGTERPHQPDEAVSVDALETMLDVTLALVAASAE